MHYMIKGEALTEIGIEACDVKSRQTDASKWSVLLGYSYRIMQVNPMECILQHLELQSRYISTIPQC
jgi:hypothetical protein